MRTIWWLAMLLCAAATVSCAAAEPKPLRLDESVVLQRKDKAGAGHVGADGVLWDERDLNSIERLMEAVQRVRKLPFQRRVDVRVANEKSMADFIRTRIQHDVAREMFTRYRAFGIIDEEMTLEKLLNEAITSMDLGGYYDERKKRLVVRQDALIGLRALEFTAHFHNGVVLHEMVHALQDQYFDLERLLAPGRIKGDAGEAFMALVEGDAMLVELEFVVTSFLGVDFASIVQSEEALKVLLFENDSRGAGARTLSLPAYESDLSFRYLSGAMFVAALFRHGGWDAVNAAYRDPPRTTTEIYHPSWYLDEWKPNGTRLPSLEGFEEMGYRILDKERAGQREVNAYLATIAVDAEGLADDWDGDEIAVVERDGEYGFVWAVRFKHVDTAQRVAQVIGEHRDRASAPEFAHARGSRVLFARNIRHDTFRMLSRRF